MQGLRGGPGPRRAVSLVEILLALVILVAAAIPILEAVGGLRLGLATGVRKEAGLYIGQAILEDVQYRLYTQSPWSESGTAGVDPADAVLVAFFAGLAEQGAKVATTTDGARSRYFAHIENLKGSGLHGILPDSYPGVYDSLRDYSCTLEAFVPVAATLAASQPTPTLCELKVTVTWKGGSRGESTPSLTLWTIVRSRGGAGGI